MLTPSGKEFRAGEIVYLRLRFMGVDKDADGKEKACCCPVDRTGGYDESDMYFLREPILVKAGVLAADLEAKAKAMAEKMRLADGG